MLAKGIRLMLVVVLVMALSASTVLAKGGGPPAGDMRPYDGTAHVDDLDVWWLYPSSGGDPVKVDFGPEYYVPHPCLNELIEDRLGDKNEVTITVGKNLVGTFRKGASGFEAQSVQHGFIPLKRDGGTLGRPVDGTPIKVYGRVEAKAEYDQVLPWEVSYDNGEWHWWRSSGQPWIRAKLLDCPPAGDR